MGVTKGGEVVSVFKSASRPGGRFAGTCCSTDFFDRFFGPWRFRSGSTGVGMESKAGLEDAAIGPVFKMVTLGVTQG